MHFVTGNVVLWPRPISVVMGRAAFDRLSAEQQAWLRDAVRGSDDEMFRGLRDLDRETIGNACRNGVQFVAAGAADRKALRAAVDPVYASLRADAATSRAIDAILSCRPETGRASHARRTRRRRSHPVVRGDDRRRRDVDGVSDG